jgi:hypothetical protein
MATPLTMGVITILTAIILLPLELSLPLHAEVL